MAKDETTHPIKKPYQQIGVTLESESASQIIGTCLFCGGKSKLYINNYNGLWDCKKCGESGNLEKFVELSCRHFVEFSDWKKIQELSKQRKLRIPTLNAWGVGWSGSFYSIPMYDTHDKILNMKRYRIGGRSMTTARCKQGLMKPLVQKGSGVVYFCEGEWDAMAMWELLNKIGEEADVIATPGSHVFNKEWIDQFRDKEIRVIYDNDVPGIKGSMRLFKMLQGNVRNIVFLHWPDDTFPEGYDFRDHYTQSTKDVTLYNGLQEWFKPYPMGVDEKEGVEVAKGYKEPNYTGSGVIPDVVERIYAKWLLLKNTEVIDVMFGTIFANRLQGDPIWLLIVAPPGGSKTALVRTLSGGEGIMEATTLTPASLISGFSSGPDPSLIPKLNKHVLVVKDFTTILSANQSAKEEIFGILRDAYDGYCEKWLGNNVHRKYESRFGIIAGVTPAIEKEGASGTVLGERFIRYRLSSTGHLGEDDNVIYRALMNVQHDTQMNEELTRVAHDVVNWDISKIPYPSCSEDLLRRIGTLAQWVSKLRGVVPRQNYTREMIHKPMSEIGTRLAKQLLKLGYGISIYRRESEISERTYQTLTQVAMGTSPDRVEEVVKQLYIHSKSYGDTWGTQDIVEWSKFPEATIRFVLQDLELLDIVVYEKKRWRLSPEMWRTMKELRLYSKSRFDALRRTHG